MTPIFLDFETFWSAQHSLTKMSAIEYVLHEETEIQSCSIREGRAGKAETFFGFDAIAARLDEIDWDDALVVAHNNSEFDAMILAWRFGIYPKMWGCTLAMARPIHAKGVGLSLRALAEHYGLKQKGSLEAINTKGKKLKDFTAAERAAMRVYNDDDTDICAELFYILLKVTDPDEMHIIDMTINMLVAPQFEADVGLLRRGLRAERGRKERVLMKLATTLYGENFLVKEALRGNGGIMKEGLQKDLRSAPKFRKLLESLGVQVPMKESPTTGRMIPALAKNDQGLLDLLEHPNEVVQAAVETKIDTQSSILETRMDRLIKVAELCDGMMPVALRYCGADTTGRWSGTMKLNQQNLPRVGGKAKISDVLRKSFRAPPGYKVVVADLSGIELRVNMFLWKVRYAMELFQNDPAKADLYKYFAAHVLYNVDEDEITKQQRQLGKVCLVEGTLVLTDRGEVPIEQVRSSDRVWDGVDWVPTGGAIYNGERETIEHDGIQATPDHQVWVEDGRKVSIGDAATQSLRLARTGAAGVPLGFGGAGVQRDRTQQGAPESRDSMHRVQYPEDGELRQPASRENAGVSVVPAEVRSACVAAASDGGRTATVHEPEQCGISQLRRTGDSVQLPLGESGGGLGYGELGTAPTHGDRPQGQQRPLRAGESAVRISPREHHQPTPVAHEAVLPASQGLPGGSIRGQHPARASKRGFDRRADTATMAHTVLQTKRRVWDLLNCGPRRRFTANGRLVSNCHLGLGFGAGYITFQTVARVMGGIELDSHQSQRIVQQYRDTHSPITRGWRTCHAALDFIKSGMEYPIDPWGLCTTTPEGIRTPKGLIRYPYLRQEITNGSAEWMYGKGRRRARIYAGKIDENIVQHLARSIIAENALAVRRELGNHYPLAHTVHDELVYVVKTGDAEEVLAIVQENMRTPPSWWPELIVWSEGEYGDNYGVCK